MRAILLSCCWLLILVVPLQAEARRGNGLSWPQWVAQLRAEAISQGISPRLFDQVFAGMTPGKRQISLDRSQPETRLTYLKYRNTRADAYRIKLGRREYGRYRALINQVGRQYGVNPCVIVSLWGMETSYGRFMGTFSVIRSLATLAYDGRRPAFFRRELLLALRILNEGHVGLADFKGEWAGATGQTQFLPSSFYQFAVDYNGDGRKDIWRTHGDIFASIANYLVQNGWQSGQPWSAQVTLPPNFLRSWASLKVQKPISEWLQMGVRPVSSAHLPHRNAMASIIIPYGGPSFMVFKNFRVFMRYNYSSYYAGTIGYMADRICQN